MTCPQCGSAVPAGTAACTQCGAHVTDPVAEMDGRDMGAGLLAGVHLAAGRHHLRVSAQGYLTVDTAITITAGRMAEVGLITLKRRPG